MLNWWMDEWMRMAKAVRFALDWNHWAKCVCWFSRLIKASEIVSVGFSNEILKDWPRDWEKNVQKSNGRKCCFQMHRTLIRGVGCARVRISGMQYSAGAKEKQTNWNYEECCTDFEWKCSGFEPWSDYRFTVTSIFSLMWSQRKSPLAVHYF